jgi:glycosyltransferase involved in cell wall biosynthesis
MIVQAQPINRERRKIDLTDRGHHCAVFVAIRGFALSNSRLLIMEQLLERGWRVLAVGKPDDHTDRLIDAGVEFHEVEFFRGGLGVRADLRAYRGLKRIYCEYQPDLIHHFQGKPIIFGCMAARACPKAAVINTVTGLGNFFIRGGFAERLAKTGYRYALRNARRTVFQNPDDRALFLDSRLLAPEAADLIVSSGVDVEKFHVPDRRTEPRPPRVLMLSRLLWEKGIGEFVEAARICKQSYPDVRFQLAGEIDSAHPSAVPSDQLDGWVEEGVIEYLGYLNDIESVLPEVSMAVLPSYREGVPRTLLEASACGIPTVATNVPGCRHAVADGETGLLVPPRDAESLAVAIGELLSDDTLRQHMGQAGRQMVEKQFDLRAISAKYLDLYRSAGLPVEESP